MRLLAVLVAVALLLRAAGALLCADTTVACALCLQMDAPCAALFRLDGCAGVTAALALATDPVAGDPRVHYFPAGWLAVLPSVDDLVCSVSAGDLAAPSSAALQLLDLLVRGKTFLQSAGLGCSDTNERYVQVPGSDVYICTCMPGHLCDADDGGANADNTSNVMLDVLVAFLLLALVINFAVGLKLVRTHEVAMTGGTYYTPPPAGPERTMALLVLDADRDR